VRRSLAKQDIAVVVADESRMGSQLLANALSESRSHRFRVVGCAVTSHELLDCVARHQPSIALVGARLEDGSLAGYKALRDLRSASPKLRVIMLLDSSDPERVIDAFRYGAKGIFCRAGSFDALCKAIDSVHRGQIWADTQQLQYLLEAVTRLVPRAVNANGVNLLSAREEQVVQCVAQGMTNREIAERLELSEHTIKNYLFRIFDKLGISTRVELILYAFKQHQPVPLAREITQTHSYRKATV
jgi:two-component system nitrate/nitrite response regulator NarL